MSSFNKSNKSEKKPDFRLVFCRVCKDTVIDLDFHDVICKHCQCFIPCSRKRDFNSEAKYHAPECVLHKERLN